MRFGSAVSTQTLLKVKFTPKNYKLVSLWEISPDNVSRSCSVKPADWFERLL